MWSGLSVLVRHCVASHLSPDRGCPATVDLMLVAKEGHARTTTSVIKTALGQDAQQARLACVNVADDCCADLVQVLSSLGVAVRITCPESVRECLPGGGGGGGMRSPPDKDPQGS